MGNVGKAVSLYDHSANSSLAPQLVRTLREVNQTVPDWLDRFARADFFTLDNNRVDADADVNVNDDLTITDDPACKPTVRRENAAASRPFANAAVAHAEPETWD